MVYWPDFEQISAFGWGQAPVTIWKSSIPRSPDRPPPPVTDIATLALSNKTCCAGIAICKNNNQEIEFAAGLNCKKGQWLDWIFFGLDIYFDHEHETKNNYIENIYLHNTLQLQNSRVSLRPDTCADCQRGLLEVLWDQKGPECLLVLTLTNTSCSLEFVDDHCDPNVVYFKRTHAPATEKWECEVCYQASWLYHLEWHPLGFTAVFQKSWPECLLYSISKCQFSSASKLKAPIISSCIRMRIAIYIPLKSNSVLNMNSLGERLLKLVMRR